MLCRKWGGSVLVRNRRSFCGKLELSISLINHVSGVEKQPGELRRFPHNALSAPRGQIVSRHDAYRRTIAYPAV
jgi:hypothetical protein